MADDVKWGKPNAEQISADKARLALGDLLDRAGFKGERFVITRHGKAIAALVGMDDLRAIAGDAAA